MLPAKSIYSSNTAMWCENTQLLWGLPEHTLPVKGRHRSKRVPLQGREGVMHVQVFPPDFSVGSECRLGLLNYYSSTFIFDKLGMTVENFLSISFRLSSYFPSIWNQWSAVSHSLPVSHGPCGPFSLHGKKLISLHFFFFLLQFVGQIIDYFLSGSFTSLACCCRKV